MGRNNARSIRLWLGLGTLVLAAAYSAIERYSEFLPWPPLQNDSGIARLDQEERSGKMVEGAGTVERLLHDDNDDSRHQRFILRLGSGQSLLVSHNIDLAPRVAQLEEGDHIAFRGQYEWNDRGGVLHWTHRDPDGHRQGGWLQHRGVTYR